MNGEGRSVRHENPRESRSKVRMFFISDSKAERRTDSAWSARGFPLQADSPEPIGKANRFRVFFAAERPSSPPARRPGLRLWVAVADVAAGRARAANRLRERERDAASAAQAAIAAALVGTVGIFVLICLATWTPLPLQIAAASLERSGFSISGIAGSWGSGYHLARVSRSESGVEVELRDLRFSPTARWKDGALEVELRDFSVRSALVSWQDEAMARSIETALRSAMSAPVDARSEREPASRGPLGRAFLQSAASFAFNLRVPTFDAGDVLLRAIGPGGESRVIQSKRFFASGVEWRGSARALSFDHFRFESDALDVYASALSVTMGRAEFSKEAFVRARPALAPEIIRAPIEARFVGSLRQEGELSSWDQIQGKAFVAGQALNCDNAILAIDRERTQGTVWAEALEWACR